MFICLDSLYIYSFRSPDGCCLLTLSFDNAFRLFDFPPALGSYGEKFDIDADPLSAEIVSYPATSACIPPVFTLLRLSLTNSLSYCECLNVNSCMIIAGSRICDLTILPPVGKMRGYNFSLERTPNSCVACF